MKILTYLILFSSILVSCSDNILDLKPLDAISENDVFSDEKLLTDYVNACYNGIKYEFHWKDFFDCMSDDYYRQTPYEPYNQGTINPDNAEGVIQNQWNSSYSYIRKINIFFDKIESSKVELELKNRLKGEMNFIRSYIYFQSLRVYGGVPIIKDVYDISSDFSVSRNSYDEVVQYIVDGLDAASQALPLFYDESNKGRATKGAALSLKSRVLLYSASELNNPTHDVDKWQHAADAAKAVIDLNQYSLHDDYANVFQDVTEESIFVRYFTQSNGHTLNFSLNPNGYGGGGACVPTQALIDAYESKDGVPVLLEDGTVNSASGYDPQNPYVDRDPRFYATILYNGAMWKGRAVETYDGGIDSPQSIVQPWNATLTGYYIKKWLKEELTVKETEKVTNPYSFFRLAEIYLNYAEALIELGQDTEAKFYINKIRNRAGLPDITETGRDLMKRYRNERRVELTMENHRFFDILRWKIAESLLSKNAMGVTITKNADNSLDFTYGVKVAQMRHFTSKQYRMPIPRSEITKSNGSLEQNPNYN